MSGEHRPGAFQRRVQNAAATRPVAWLSARILHRVDGAVFRASRSRNTLSAAVSGLPIVMLTTVGARTGQRRTCPVVGIPDGDRIVVIASNFGQERHPSWYHNLRACPRAEVSADGVTMAYEAHELGGDEWEYWYQRGVDLNPGWTAYRARVHGRRIPVLRLEPVST